VTMFKELNSESRAQLEALAAQFLVEQNRVGKPGVHCFWCGSCQQKLRRCDCGYGSSFGCSEPSVYACPDCAAAHKQLSSHLRTMFSFSKSSRVDSRRAAYFRHLVEASEKINPALYKNLCKTDAWDDRDETFRERSVGAFRKANFTQFQSLARGISERVDAYLLRSATRFLAGR
jgi:hypothetical protein